MTRTTQVTLIDGTTVTVREPEWCAGVHEDGLHLVDLMHDSAETFATVHGQHGPWRLLSAALSSSPFATNEADRMVRLTVDMGGEVEGFDPDQVEELANALIAHAEVLRGLGRRVRELREEAAQ